MYSAYPPTIEKMYSLQQVLFCIHKCLFVIIFRVSLFFKKCLEIHSFQFGICSLVENITICPLLPEDGGPLPVFFKLPISEISEIDDHKSVTILLFFFSFSPAGLFELLKADIRTLTDFSPCLLPVFRALFDPTILIFTILSLYSD